MPIDTVNLWGFPEEPPKTKRGNSILTLGSINVNGEIRQKDDFYATDPNALKSLLEYETFKHEVWEPACGSGWLSNVLEEYGYDVKNSDIIERATLNNFECNDFFSYEVNSRDIITNPPYFCVNEFVRHALDISTEGTKIAMILRLTFLEGKKRRQLIFNSDKPRKIYVFSERVLMAKDGIMPQGSAVAYAWFIWEKGYKGNTELFWI